jgi:hypothetical protein
VEELAGVPIRFAQPDDPRSAAALDREVSVELQATTVGEILDALLEQASLVRQSDPSYGIRLSPKGE